MATPQELQAQLDNLLAVKRSGTLKVTYEGKEITYRSMSDLNEAINELRAEIAAATGKPRPRVGFTTFSRG